jgi:ADP-ribose pyrophosphatase YjhB (NUDIX family)
MRTFARGNGANLDGSPTNCQSYLMANDDTAGRERPGAFSLRIPEGDTREREVCGTCGFVNYVNPKIVTGAVVRADDGRILMCRRAIEPGRGLWTIPAGYLEEHETVEAAARREAREEASAEITLEALLAIYSIPRLSQVQLIYKARLVTSAIAPGPESLETMLVHFEEIPWRFLAFPSVQWALRHFAQVRDRDVFMPFTNPVGETGDFERRSAVRGS